MRIGLRFSYELAVASIALCGLAAPRVASADWPRFGRPIVTQANSQVHSAIATDGLDGAIITWQDARSTRVNIFAQHVLASGDVDAAWPVNGRALLNDSLALADAAGGQFFPSIITDGHGGAIVVWQDLRTPGNDIDVFAQHILATGVVDGAWPANGVPLIAIPGVQNSQVMVPDGAGGAIVAWEDNRLGVSNVDIFTQHVLATGRVDARWPANGLAVTTAPGSQQLPVIVEDGAGGAIISWQDPRSTATELDVYAQHVLNSGVVDPVWPLNGRAVCTATGVQGRPAIASDGARGAIVAWSDGRLVNTFHIFADHVLSSGVVDPAWPVNGRLVSDAFAIAGRPLAISDGAGGAIVNWSALNPHLNLYAQHVTAAGVVDPAWPAGGRALSLTPRQQIGGPIVPDGAGGAIVAWEDSSDVFAQHVLSSGALDAAFPDTGRALVTLPSQQGDVALVATRGAGAIVSWTDTRNIPLSSPDIFALQVQATNGTAGVPNSDPAGISFAPPSPNPARASLALRFELAHDGRVALDIFDVRGRLVRDLGAAILPAGEHRVAWDLHDARGNAVRSGLYFARLEVDGRSITRKFAALQ